jgi:hypothetical protein
MSMQIPNYTYETEYKSVQDIFNDKNIDYNFKPERKSFLGELQKSLMIELLLTKMKPDISVFFILSKNGKYVPFYGYNLLKALLDFVNNKYKLFRMESLPELTGKKFNEIPYVMRADLEKPIIKCYFFKNLSCKDLKFLHNNLSNSGFPN